MNRSVARLGNEDFDLLILGGGITGAGVGLDAALRGLRVALIDKADFASGTSSVSSKLIHGGLRYLEHGKLGLVYEALHERALLLGNAPHLVRPLRFVLPVFGGQRRAGWQWRVGLALYDLLAGRGNIRRSRPLAPARLPHDFPGLRRDQLLAALEFYDAQMDDARLCLEVLLTAADQGACIANYVEAVGFEWQGGRIAGVRAVDRIGGGEVIIRAGQVVNATGPWVDRVCRLAGDGGGPYLASTKGVHILGPGRELAAGFLLLHPVDGRVFFVLPWQGRTLIGTTDTLAREGPDSLHVLPEEIDYLLAGHNHYFAPPLRQADLLGSFAGLRPLVRGRPGEPSALSREFRLVRSPGGLLSAVGGKYTTYRHMAEQITDLVARRLGNRLRCRTADFPLIGTPLEPWPRFLSSAASRLEREHGLQRSAALHLLRRYGRRAERVAGYLGGSAELREPLIPGEPDLRGELLYQRDHELALLPEDHMLRRTRLGLFHPELLHDEVFLRTLLPGSPAPTENRGVQ